MGLPELIESLSLIGGRYGLGESAAVPAPALGLLQAAHAATGGSGSVTLLVRMVRSRWQGRLAPEQPTPLVNHS